MPGLPLYTVDTFTRDVFRGNSAAVVLIKEALPDELCQNIAAEMKLSETAFVRPLTGKSFAEENNFELRWFTPTVEIGLCGHATLATAHLLFSEVSNTNHTLSFETLSGTLHCSKTKEDTILMNFPQYADVQQVSQNMTPAPPVCLNELVKHVVGDLPVDSLHISPKGKNFLLIMLDKSCTRAQLESLSPNGDTLMQIYPEAEFLRGISVTLAGSAQNGCVDEQGRVFDFVSRYFAPWLGVPEDPATGSLHCALGPLWKQYLNKTEFYSFQCYPGRGAQFELTVKPDGRIDIVGAAVTVIQGEINV